jgi:hypothetical protein
MKGSPLDFIRVFFREDMIKTAFPAGHFYSPIVDPSELKISELWPPVPPKILGIDFNEGSHEEILGKDFPRYFSEYLYPEDEKDVQKGYDFFTKNSQFSWLDARLAFVLMRKWRPNSIIEIGSGFSSLLFADVNRRFFNSECCITCIEPYPKPFLETGVPGIEKIMKVKVQEVPLSFFETLKKGDVLFIDSSHISKTGSDVNYIYFEILPRLVTGVYIHIHDVFFPHEYPKEWVINENRSWNEQYILRALLMYTSAFRVVFGSSYAYTVLPQLLKTALAYSDGRFFGGGSLWIEKL